MTLGARPEPFSAFTTPEFWDDPHISAEMLKAHLAPEVDAASRRHEFIDRATSWMISSFGLGADSRVLDLGCGPGLYALRLARAGAKVHGIDISSRSIAYAQNAAADEKLSATFARADYLEGELGGPYDFVLFAYEDLNVLSPAQRAVLLRKVRGSLADGGALLMDVTSAARFDAEAEGESEADDLMGGFWAERPYRGRHETWKYAELRLVLDRFTIEKDGRSRQFWNWMQCLTPAEVDAELTAAGFSSTRLLGDIAGGAYDPSAPSFAVVAQTASV